MKKIILLICFLFAIFVVVAQGQMITSDSIVSSHPKLSVDTILMEISYNIDRIAYKISSMDENHGRYKIYKTENIYNLLKLDTATGQIEQIQWSLNDDKEFINTLNSRTLSYSGKTGTFELYPTNNIYQFILLDTTDGRVWHVQWGTDSKKRWIRRIY